MSIMYLCELGGNGHKQTLADLVYHAKEYQESNENKCRSLKILYQNGVLAKEKYKSICQILKTNVDLSLANPKLAFIKSEDIHNVHDFVTKLGKDKIKQNLRI